MPSGTCCLRRDTDVLYHYTFTLSSLFLVNFSTFYTSAFYNFFCTSLFNTFGQPNQIHIFSRAPIWHWAFTSRQPARVGVRSKGILRASSLQSPTKKSVAYKGFALLHLHLYNYTSFNGLILTPIPIVGAIVTLLRN